MLPSVRSMLCHGRRLLPSLCSGSKRSLLAHITSECRVVPEAPSDILHIPPQYLRAVDRSNYDDNTMQRVDAGFDLVTGKPTFLKRDTAAMEIASCTHIDGHYQIVWNDGLVSIYSDKWVEETLNEMSGATERSDRVLWTGLTEEKVRSSKELSLSFADTITAEGMYAALQTLYCYGILLVTNTPIDDNGAGVAALASSLGGGSVKNDTSLLKHYYTRGRRNGIVLPHGTDGPMRTLYGTVWSTTLSGQANGASVADSSYGMDALPLHTDMTYSRDPPGLQIFTMVRPSTSGGETILCDGFAAADRLRRTNSLAFDVLSTTTRRYRCIDNTTGWHIEASGPVISLDRTNDVYMIRHNDLDRLPDLPRSHNEDPDEFYEKIEYAHHAWDAILADDDTRLVIRLKEGDTIVVANQRCLHGRLDFQANHGSPRAITGCYMSQEELNSRFRMLGFRCY